VQTEAARVLVSGGRLEEVGGGGRRWDWSFRHSHYTHLVVLRTSGVGAAHVSTSDKSPLIPMSSCFCLCRRPCWGRERERERREIGERERGEREREERESDRERE